jgi:Amino acid permease
MAKHEPGYERLGAKVLSLPDVIAQSVGFMGPVFSAAFVIPLVVGVISASGKGGGVASPLSVLIAAVGVFAIGAIVSRYAKEVHAAGSLYDYVTRGLGERAGTAAGWLYYAGQQRAERPDEEPGVTPEPPATRAVLVTGGGTGIGAAVDAGTLPYDPRVEIRREPGRPERDR